MTAGRTNGAAPGSVEEMSGTDTQPRRWTSRKSPVSRRGKLTEYDDSQRNDDDQRGRWILFIKNNKRKGETHVEAQEGLKVKAMSGLVGD